MKKFFVVAAVIAASVFGVMKANSVYTTNKMSNLQLENVEALAEGEDPDSDFKYVTYIEVSDKLICQEQGPHPCKRGKNY